MNNEKFIHKQLIDYAKSTTPDRWSEIEKNLPVQAACLSPKRNKIFAAHPFCLAASLILIVTAAITSTYFMNKSALTRSGDNLIAQDTQSQLQDSLVSAASSNTDSAAGISLAAQLPTTSPTLKTSITSTNSTAGGSSAGICIFPYIKYDHKIYRLTPGTDKPVIGKQVGYANNIQGGVPVYAIQGVDPSSEIVENSSSFIYRYQFFMEDIITWNGAVYQIDSLIGNSGEQGNEIGTVNGHTIYAIQGYDPSQRVLFQLNGDICTDAVRQ